MASGRDWQERFDAWVAPFAEALGTHPHGRRCLPAYLTGLVLPGERKSLEPLAARALGPGADRYQSLHHFLADSPWDAGPLEALLAAEADRLVGGPDACLTVDDTALPKKGRHSVGVAHQYCGALGKTANCQSVVTLTLARGEVPVCAAARLFLPREWTDDPERCRRAKVPAEVARAGHRTKGELALGELDRLLSAGVRFGTVLADAGYGNSGPWRRELSRRGLKWAVGVLPNCQLWPAGAAAPPARRRGGQPRAAGPAAAPRSARDAAAALPAGAWHRVGWRAGTLAGRGRPLSAEFAAVRVLPADGPKATPGARHRGPGGEECWLVAERREGGEVRFHLSNLGPESTPGELAAALKARWSCEQAHQQMKEELGLDHFEGRGWRGLHRHMLLCRMAHCFLQGLRLGKKKVAGPSGRAAPPDAARGAPPAGGMARAAGALPPLPRKVPAAAPDVTE